MNSSPSFFSEHPWMTFFLGMAAVSGVVHIVRGYPQADQLPRFPQPTHAPTAPDFFAPHVRGTYR
jgi:hypothetical protein